MPQMLHAAHEFARSTGVAASRKRIARGAKLALTNFESEFGELHGAQKIAGVALVVHRQLFAGKSSFLRIGDQFVPQAGGSFAVATTFCHQRQFASCLWTELGRKTSIERKRAGRMGKVSFAFPVKEFRQTEKIERVGLCEAIFARSEQGIDFAEKSRESTQVHLIVSDDSSERLAASAAQIIEVELRDESGGDVVFAAPAEAGGVEHVALEFDEAHGTEAQSPQGAGGMEQVEMRGELRDAYGAGHGEAIFKERPIEGFPVEGDKHRTLGDAGREFVKKGIFFVQVAEEKLFNLKAAGVPPAEPNEESVSAGAAGESGSFGVEEKPFFRVAYGRVSAAGDFFVASAREEFEGGGRWRHEFRGGEPVSDGEMLSVVICGDAPAEEQADGIGFVGEAQRAWLLRRRAGRF